MIGSFLTRGLVMVFGYAYPAYECYKTVEKNKPDIEQLRFWCQYWILVAILTVCERVGDTFVSWVPMYSEAKLAFFIYLWYPKTKGTTYVYDSFFRPYIAKHETEIDRNLLELKTRAGDIAVSYWQRAASYGQTRIFEILQYIAAQSTPRPPKRTTTKTPASSEEPPSTSSKSSSENEKEEAEELAPQALKVTPTVAGLNAQKDTSVQQPDETSSQLDSNESEAMQIESAPIAAAAKENASPPAQETNIMGEVVRATRGRLRKTRSTASR
ncbi:putative HVA22-like protein g [Diospyros lotus]|uniref:putative HVA22-like protein g n=1 Tax=Diospyros lotus TaxID=55363 RepID=UPI00224CCA1C|nr:putative HVA22-like protein g [Diospyros lotus]